MVPSGTVWSPMVLYDPVCSCMVLNCPIWFCMVLVVPVWSSMVLLEISDNYTSQDEIIHNSIRKLENNKKALNSNIYHVSLDSVGHHHPLISSS